MSWQVRLEGIVGRASVILVMVCWERKKSFLWTETVSYLPMSSSSSRITNLLPAAGGIGLFITLQLMARSSFFYIRNSMQQLFYLRYLTASFAICFSSTPITFSCLVLANTFSCLVLSYGFCWLTLVQVYAMSFQPFRQLGSFKFQSLTGLCSIWGSAATQVMCRMPSKTPSLDSKLSWCDQEIKFTLSSPFITLSFCCFLRLATNSNLVSLGKARQEPNSTLLGDVLWLAQILNLALVLRQVTSMKGMGLLFCSLFKPSKHLMQRVTTFSFSVRPTNWSISILTLISSRSRLLLRARLRWYDCSSLLESSSRTLVSCLSLSLAASWMEMIPLLRLNCLPFWARLLLVIKDSLTPRYPGQGDSSLLISMLSLEAAQLVFFLSSISLSPVNFLEWVLCLACRYSWAMANTLLLIWSLSSPILRRVFALPCLAFSRPSFSLTLSKSRPTCSSQSKKGRQYPFQLFYSNQPSLFLGTMRVWSLMDLRMDSQLTKPAAMHLQFLESTISMLVILVSMRYCLKARFGVTTSKWRGELSCRQEGAAMPQKLIFMVTFWVRLLVKVSAVGVRLRQPQV